MKLLAGLAAVLVLAGCPAKKKKPVDASPGIDVAVDGLPELLSGDGGADRAAFDTCLPEPDAVCCPGETNGCTEDQRGLLICRDDGTGWEIVPCLDEFGDDTLCMLTAEFPTGQCTACIPGMKRCKDDDIVLQCDEFGTAFEQFADCNGAQTAQICFEGGCVKLCDLNEKWNMYMGCDFWAADLDNYFGPGGRDGYNDAAGSQYSVVVSNPHHKYPADVQVFNSEGLVEFDSADSPLPTEPLEPGALRIYNLPRRDVDGTILAPLAYRVQASIPITAYQFNPLDNVDVFSNDGSLLLPSNVLGKFYYYMSREQTFETTRANLTVIAVRTGDTQVTVDVTAPTLVGENAHTGETIKHLEPGDTYTATLTQFDVLNIETDKMGSDLTGSRILASRDVAVIGASECANVPNTAGCDEEKGLCEYDGETKCITDYDCIQAGFNTCCCDHIEHQLFPVKSWGLRYLASKMYPRNQESDYYRIIAAENNTVVTTLPPQTVIPVLDAGEWIEFASKQNFEIVAKKPIMVGHFMASEHAPEPNVNGQPGIDDAGTGDPAFMLIVPVEQYRQDYVFLAPDKYLEDYVTIVAPSDAQVWFDCEEIVPATIAEKCEPLAESDFELFGTGEYGTAKFEIDDGVHRLYADMPIGVAVYGYDQYVSYAYAGGLNMIDLGLIDEPGR